MDRQESPALYTRVERGRIGGYVVFSGDPWRVEVLKDLLEAPDHIAFAREFNTYTGLYCGMRITVSSTGIGAPSAAVAMEEMYGAGMKAAVRMGTAMGLRDELLGSFIIPIGAMREESTSAAYAPAGYPAVADMGLVDCMNRAAKANGGRFVNGVICSMDRFYGRMRGSLFSARLGDEPRRTFETLRRYQVCGVDMESSCILVLAGLMGVPACVVTMTTVLADLKDALKGEARTRAEELLCRVVLDGVILHGKENADGIR
jgi:uridine phosphorylase